MEWPGFTDRQILCASLFLLILYLTIELCSDVGRGVQAEQLLPVAGNDLSRAVRHCPLTGDGEGGPLYLQPVNSIRVSDRAVLSNEMKSVSLL